MHRVWDSRPIVDCTLTIKLVRVHYMQWLYESEHQLLGFILNGTVFPCANKILLWGSSLHTNCLIQYSSNLIQQVQKQQGSIYWTWQRNLSGEFWIFMGLKPSPTLLINSPMHMEEGFSIEAHIEERMSESDAWRR